MKCDELKAYNVVATADVNPEVVDSLGCTEWAGYDKDEVDAAIAELKAEINRKEAVGQRWFVRCINKSGQSLLSTCLPIRTSNPRGYNTGNVPPSYGPEDGTFTTKKPSR